MKTFLKSNWAVVLFNLFLLVGFYAFSANVKSTAREELAGYVRTEKFDDYKAAHQQWGEEVLKSINHRLANLEELGRADHDLLLRISDRIPTNNATKGN